MAAKKRQPAGKKKPARRSHSYTRTRKTCLKAALDLGTKPEKADRLNAILDLMEGGEWVTGATVRQLAKAWDISLGVVKRDAGNASNLLSINETGAQLEARRARLVATLETTIQRAMAQNQLRTVIEAVERLARITGVEAPQRIDLNSGTLADFLSLALGPEGGGKTDT
jgi:hypothetical protein